MNLVYDGYNFRQIKEALGKRPGGYRVDPDYLRQGIAQKPYFWDQYYKKWQMIRIGDSFFMDEDGIPRKTGMRTNGSKTW
jgi:hypothetical protein